MTGSAIEWVREIPAGARPRMAMLDFDGTLSLIRAGWQDVMAGLMLEDLLAASIDEPAETLDAELRAMIDRTTGEPTLSQMQTYRAMALARGGDPPAAERLMDEYRRRLAEVIAGRKQDIASGREPAERYMVPGARAFLEEFDGRGIGMFLASGTDHDQVVLEAELLDLSRFFALGIGGAVPPPGRFSKDLLVKRLVHERLYTGQEMLAVGDGPVEIAAVARVGGIAVGVAGAEQAPGALDPAKRQRLIEAGAHAILVDLTPHAALAERLFQQTAQARGG